MNSPQHVGGPIIKNARVHAGIFIVQILCKKCAKLCQIVQKYDKKCKVFAIGLNHLKTKNPRVSAGYRGGNTGTRTLDPMIKSHLLYQLSYVPKTEPERDASVTISKVRRLF